MSETIFTALGSSLLEYFKPSFPDAYIFHESNTQLMLKNVMDDGIYFGFSLKEGTLSMYLSYTLGYRTQVTTEQILNLHNQGIRFSLFKGDVSFTIPSVAYTLDETGSLVVALTPEEVSNFVQQAYNAF